MRRTWIGVTLFPLAIAWVLASPQASTLANPGDPPARVARLSYLEGVFRSSPRVRAIGARPRSITR